MSEKNALWQALGLPAEKPTGNALKPLWDFPPALPVAPFGSLAPTPSPAMRVAEALLGYTPPPSKLPARTSLGGIFGLVPPPSLPTTRLGSVTPTPVLPAPSIERMSYFAFDFDDIMRVNNVRQSGKIGPRVNGNARGFKDRSVWEKSNAKTKDGLKRFMQNAVQRSGAVCVMVGTTTWQSFWVRYEIALSVVGERGLLAVDLNSINHSDQTGPDPLGVNPLHFMGVYKDGENWYLVERKMVETANGPELKWNWYSEYTKPVKRPAYVPDIAQTVIPLALYTDRYDFMAEAGAANMGQWFDMAARKSGR